MELSKGCPIFKWHGAEKVRRSNDRNAVAEHGLHTVSAFLREFEKQIDVFVVNSDSLARDFDASVHPRHVSNLRAALPFRLPLSPFGQA